jgi:hypothetical protein
VEEANMVGVCIDERISKTVERSVVESVFLKLLVRNYFRKAAFIVSENDP